MTNFSFLKGTCRVLLLIHISVIANSDLHAQINKYVGKWSTSYHPPDGGPETHMDLEIGSPEKEIIYPAILTISCDSFFASYRLFLVKKTYNQLGISIHKAPVSEIPFSLGGYTRFMNNIFQYNKDDRKGVSMTLVRLKPEVVIQETELEVDEKYASLSKTLKDFFLRAVINLKKDDGPDNLVATKTTGMLYSGTEFGLLDTVHVSTDTVAITIPYNKKNDTDTVSVAVNGTTIAEQVDIKRKTKLRFLELARGENIVVLFGDNYGAFGSNSGKVLLDARSQQIPLEVSVADPFATFVVARLFYEPVKDTIEKIYETNTYVPPSMTVRPTRISYDKATTDAILKRSTTVMGELETNSAQITLALWDDALEDGDTISLNINGKWLVQEFSVKKATQFINVTLQSGPNTITFIAENLGSIPPNTSVLEIIDGKKRRSFKIETTLTSNNAINIFYDFKP